MTPEQHINKIAGRLLEDPDFDAIEDALLAEREAGILFGREAAAKCAEGFNGVDRWALDIAAAIRAQGRKG